MESQKGRPPADGALLDRLVEAGLRRGPLEAAKCSARRGCRRYASGGVVRNCPTEGSRRRRRLSLLPRRRFRRPQRPEERRGVGCVGGGRRGHSHNRQWAGRQDGEGGKGDRGRKEGGVSPAAAAVAAASGTSRLHLVACTVHDAGQVFQRTPQQPQTSDLVRSTHCRSTQHKRHPSDSSFTPTRAGSEGRGTSPGRRRPPGVAKLTQAPVLDRIPSTAGPVTPRRPQTSRQRTEGTDR